LETGVAGAETAWLHQAGLRGELRGSAAGLHSVYQFPPASKEESASGWGITGFRLTINKMRASPRNIYKILINQCIGLIRRDSDCLLSQTCVNIDNTI
jgi:hypothetical protein